MKKAFLSLIMLAFVANVSMAQTDFNFSFYPAPKYTKFEVINRADTTQKTPEGRPTIVTKTDTVSKVVHVLIEKQNGRFSVRTLANISESLYDMNVVFIGMDANGNMVYKAKTESGETIFVNPVAGTVEIAFQSCFDEPQPGGLLKKHCNTIRHIFGNFVPATLLSTAKK